MRTPLLHQLAFMPNRKTYIGPRQRMAAHGFYAMGQFGGIGFEKFAPRRGAVKQFFHFYRGAGFAGHGAQFAAAPIQQKGLRLAHRARQNGAVGNRVDGRQCLTPKAHGGHRFEVLQITDLASGMALKSQWQLGALNAHAIVFHGNQAHAAGQQAHRHLACAGV